MALTRRTGARFQASIWPGFVDAMTGLLLVLMFVLTIFTVVQFVLRETIIGQGNELDQLNATIVDKDRELAQLAAQIAQLGNTLGLERQANDALRAEVGQLTSSLRRSEEARSAQASQIDSFEEQVAALLLQQDAATQRIGELEGAALTLETQLAAARDEIDAGAEAARLAAAQREVMEATLKDLRRQAADADVLRGQVADLDARLTEEEQAKIAQAAAVENLRRDLEGAQTEITALQLSLRDQTKQAEETLSLLAATRGQADDLDKRLIAALAELDATKESAQATQESLRADLQAALAAKLAAENQAQVQLTQAEQRSALLSQAQTELENQRDISTEAQRQVELLSQQIAALQNELGVLGGLLDASEAREDALQIDIANLGSRLNGAMAEALFNARRVTALEAAEAARLQEERDRLAAEAKELKNVRSRFLAGVRDLLEGRDGVELVGDRFVFSSEVLFPPAGATLAPEGRAQIRRIAQILQDLAAEIPPEIDWVIQVDGHTDNIPVGPSSPFLR